MRSGSQPPDVVLVCNHIEPASTGGATTIDNLITSCTACNQGKADPPWQCCAICAAYPT